MAEKKMPQRKCVACTEMIGKKGALRVVKNKEGAVFFDKTGKANGRGAYICKDLACAELARKSKKLERSLKCAVPDEVYEQLTAEINK